MLPLEFGIVLFLVAFIVGRIVEEKALRCLSVEQKGRLVEAFAGTRLVMLIPLAGLAAAYVGLSRTQLPASTVISIYGAVLLAFIAGSEVLVHRRLRALELPPEFTRLSRIGRCIKLAGMALLIFSLR